jgi:hypothetical protein
LISKPPLGGFCIGEMMSDFSTALLRLWPNGDAKIPALAPA